MEKFVAYVFLSILGYLAIEQCIRATFPSSTFKVLVAYTCVFISACGVLRGLFGDWATEVSWPVQLVTLCMNLFTWLHFVAHPHLATPVDHSFAIGRTCAPLTASLTIPVESDVRELNVRKMSSCTSRLANPNKKLPTTHFKAANFFALKSDGHAVDSSGSKKDGHHHHHHHHHCHHSHGTSSDSKVHIAGEIPSHTFDTLIQIAKAVDRERRKVAIKPSTATSEASELSAEDVHSEDMKTALDGSVNGKTNEGTKNIHTCDFVRVCEYDPKRTPKCSCQANPCQTKTTPRKPDFFSTELGSYEGSPGSSNHSNPLGAGSTPEPTHPVTVGAGEEMWAWARMVAFVILLSLFLMCVTRLGSVYVSGVYASGLLPRQEAIATHFYQSAYLWSVLGCFAAIMTVALRPYLMQIPSWYQ